MNLYRFFDYDNNFRCRFDNDNNFIRYDRTDFNRLTKCVLIFGILFGVLLLMECLAWRTTLRFSKFLLYLFSVLHVVPFIFIWILVKWGACYAYLTKLKKRKMLVPERKEDFQYNLLELVTKETRELEHENRVAFLEVALSLVMTICFLVWENNLILEYTTENGALILTVPVLGFWFFMVLRTVFHCSKRKYKEETNPDPARKPRASFFSFLAFVIFCAVASALWIFGVLIFVQLVEHDEKNRDTKFLTDMNLAAVSALNNLNEESLEEFSVIFEKNGYRVECSQKDQADVAIQKFMDEFSNLTDGRAASLTEINNTLKSGFYGTLEKLEIIVDGRTGSTKLVVTPKKKGWKPLVIPDKDRQVR